MRRKDKNPLMELVEKKYQLPYWVFIHEFRDDTGFNAMRSADGLAVGLYRSRGQEIIGFELKVSRSDWLREIANPDKAECIARFCDKWYVVVPSEPAVVKVEELGPWGLMVAGEKKAIVTIEAKALKPAEIPRFFLSAIVKQAVDSFRPPPQEAAELKKTAAWRAGYESGKNSVGYEAAHYATLQERVKAFEEASGIRIGSYSDGKELGERVRVMQSEEGWNAAKTSYRRALEIIVSSGEKATQELKELEKPFALSP